MFIDKVGPASRYQPSVIDGSAPQNGVNRAPAPSQPDATEHSTAAVAKAADAANRQLEDFASQIRFNISNESGRTIVRMVDTQTKQVLLQIPNEQMMKIAQDPAKLQGLILSQKA